MSYGSSRDFVGRARIIRAVGLPAEFGACFCGMLRLVTRYFLHVLAEIKGGFDRVTVGAPFGMSAEGLKMSFGNLALIILEPSLIARPS